MSARTHTTTLGPDAHELYVEAAEGNHQRELDRASGSAALKMFRGTRVPLNPPLPDGWSSTAHNERPSWHAQLWGRPYIESEENDQWPSGVRYDVRCLDGGAWDRPTNLGMFGTFDEAMACAEAVMPTICSFGIAAFNPSRRCTQQARWASTFDGHVCHGALGILGWCDEHKPNDSKEPHGLEPLPNAQPSDSKP